MTYPFDSYKTITGYDFMKEWLTSSDVISNDDMVGIFSGPEPHPLVASASVPSTAEATRGPN